MHWRCWRRKAPPPTRRLPASHSRRRSMPDRLAEVKNVKDFGAVGNGNVDDTLAIQAALNAAYGSPSSPNGGGSGVHRNAPVFFPAGKYRITAPLTSRSIRGAHVYCAGRVTTTIQNTNGGSVFVTNGCDYSRFERMSLQASGTGVAFDLDREQLRLGGTSVEYVFGDEFWGRRLRFAHRREWLYGLGKFSSQLLF